MTLPDVPLYLPYEPGPFRMALGLQAVPQAELLAPDADFAPHLAQRRALLRDRRTDVLAELPEGRAASAELLEVLATHLPAHHPGFRLDGRTMHLPDGTAQKLDADTPIAIAGHLAQEDFCLLLPEDGTLRLVSGVLCFPSRWSLAAKMGHPMAAIHGPVPLYGEKLARPVDRFLTLLGEGRTAIRHNWSVMDDPALFQLSGHGVMAVDPTITPANVGDRVVLRTERQSFRRLPASGAILFAIHIYVTPIARILALPGEPARLAAAIRALPPEMSRYKSLAPFRDVLLAALDTSHAPAPATNRHEGALHSR